jgi:hypothetical protein
VAFQKHLFFMFLVLVGSIFLGCFTIEIMLAIKNYFATRKDSAARCSNRKQQMTAGHLKFAKISVINISGLISCKQLTAVRAENKLVVETEL